MELRRTTEAPPRRWSRRGRIPEHIKSPELTKVPLCLRRNASPFWIILLLVWANSEHLEPLTLNQRVPGSSPGASTTILLQTIDNPKARWEPAAVENIFGKLLGTSRPWCVISSGGDACWKTHSARIVHGRCTSPARYLRRNATKGR